MTALAVRRTRPGKTAELAPIGDLDRVAKLAVDAVASVHTKRAYASALRDFLAWHHASGGGPLTKARVRAWIEDARARGISDSSLNVRLSAIRKFCREAADNGLLADAQARSIASIQGIPARGTRMGNWLTQSQAQQLLSTPDTKTLIGLRDRAILAILLGSGLRRAECATLTVEHIAQREGRWLIVDLVGKRNRKRSVPLAWWTKTAVDAWLAAAGIKSGPIFRPVRKGGAVGDMQVSAQCIYNVVAKALDDAQLVDAAGQRIPLAPHDLRRTYAKLARKGAATLEQIQLTMGHESLDVTRKYLGSELDLENPPCDVLGLTL